MKTKGTVSGICLLLKGFLDATMTESVMVPDANLVNRSWSPPPDRHCQLSLPLFAETARMHAHIQQNPIDSLGCCVSAAATLWEPCLINLLKSMQVQVICFYVFPDHTFFAWRSPEKHMSELLLNAKLLWCAAWFSRQAAPCAGFNGLLFFTKHPSEQKCFSFRRTVYSSHSHVCKQHYNVRPARCSQLRKKFSLALQEYLLSTPSIFSTDIYKLLVMWLSDASWRNKHLKKFVRGGSGNSTDLSDKKITRRHGQCFIEAQIIFLLLLQCLLAYEKNWHLLSAFVGTCTAAWKKESDCVAWQFNKRTCHFSVRFCLVAYNLHQTKL